MKIMTVNINGNTIEFDNNMWTGHESIFVNKQLVSKKFSFFGCEHYFEVNEQGDYVEYHFKTGFGLRYGGIIYELYRSGELLISSNNVKNIFSTDRGSFSFNGHTCNSYREEDFV